MSAPDYHFIYLDPTLGIEWLFDSARRYWDRFRPIVVSDLELVQHVHRFVKDGTPIIAITALARRDMADKVTTDVRTKFPLVVFDSLVYDTPEELRVTLDGRAAFNQRFGLPGAAMPTLIATPVGPTPTFGPVIADQSKSDENAPTATPISGN
jgi:hypothetical protein